MKSDFVRITKTNHYSEQASQVRFCLFYFLLSELKTEKTKMSERSSNMGDFHALFMLTVKTFRRNLEIKFFIKTEASYKSLN